MMILFHGFNTFWVLKKCFLLTLDCFCSFWIPLPGLLVLDPVFLIGGSTNSSHPFHLQIFKNEASKSWLEALGMGYVLPSRLYCILKLEWFIVGMSKCQLSIVFPALESFCFSREDLCRFLIQCWGNRLNKVSEIKHSSLISFLTTPKPNFQKMNSVSQICIYSILLCERIFNHLQRKKHVLESLWV